jgi:hypothetical protein
MNLKKQVNKSHYEFKNYMDIDRWCSVWHQLKEISNLNPKSVLEIGPGPGVFKHTAALFDIRVETLDLDPALKPDHLGSATALTFKDNAYEVVCAFQMLEHLPYEVSLQAFSEMVRVSERYVVISLPDARTMWRYQFQIPKFGTHTLLVPRPRFKAPVHEFDGEHYWEINKHGYPLDRTISDFSLAGAKLIKTYRVPENPYHRFFIFEK